MTMNSENNTSAASEHLIGQKISAVYVIVMLFVLTVGFLGNVLSIIILRYPEHRRKIITPLMMNLAVADILMIVLVYPAMVVMNLLGEPLREGSLECSWSSFANGTTGVTSITTLVAMSGIMYYAIKQPVPRPHIQSKHMILLVASTWLSGILINLPPLIGWSKVVPGKAGFSCAPDWISSDPWGIAYIFFLLFFGFFLPLTVIVIFHYLIYRLIGHVQVPLEGRVNYIFQVIRHKSQMKLVRMTALSVTAFLMSWLPYASVSIASLINGHHVLSTGEAEIPELMAKASVIYNPVVYTFMNGAYRASLWGLITGNKEVRVNPNHVTQSALRGSSFFSGAVHPSHEETAL